MKRWPLIASFVLFIVLCASAAYWAMQLFKPPVRPVAAPPRAATADIKPEAAAALFGGRAGPVAVASNYQLRGVIFSGNARDSIAILSADGKPAQAIRANTEVVPGVTVKEVHRGYVLLSEGGVTKRVELPESVKDQVNVATNSPTPATRTPTPPPQTPTQTPTPPAQSTPTPTPPAQPASQPTPTPATPAPTAPFTVPAQPAPASSAPAVPPQTNVTPQTAPAPGGLPAAPPSTTIINPSQSAASGGVPPNSGTGAAATGSSPTPGSDPRSQLFRAPNAPPPASGTAQ